MKTTTLATLLLLSPLRGDEEPFTSLAEDYAAKARTVEQMDRIVLKDVRIQNQPLPDAVAHLRAKGPDGEVNLVDFEIVPRFSSDDPFRPGDWEEPSVTFESASISFARAIDQMCNTSKLRWQIKIDGKAKPLLRIEPEEMAMLDDEADLPVAEPPLDLKKPGQRDLLISYWYLNMRRVVDSLESHTGHRFKPVAKLDAGPVEILEEQAAFLKAFLEETERIANDGRPADDGTDR
ncbi:hypothetical protein [Luteolibacter marinus]|uniref:hypothetical protein n=1 Tax=Luteolibacter marinus TaxID=2776705 RepID=UPI001866B934|nr:hypothetical protein [Luteolibacter marinus]